MAGVVEVSVKYKKPTGHKTVALVFNDGGYLVDFISSNTRVTDDENLRFLSDTDEAYKINQQYAILEKSLGSQQRAILKEEAAAVSVPPSAYQIDLFSLNERHIVSGEMKKTLILPETANRYKVGAIVFVSCFDYSSKYDQTAEVQILKHNLVPYDEEQDQYELMTFRNALHPEGIPKSSIVKKHTITRGASPFHIVGILQNSEFQLEYKDVERALTSNQDDILCTLPEIYQVLASSGVFNGVVQNLYEKVDLRRGQHTAFKPEQLKKVLNLQFEWTIVGRSFNIDLGVIIFNKAGYPIDYLYHDKVRSYDGAIVRLFQNSLREKFPNITLEAHSKKILEIVSVDFTKLSPQCHSIVFTTSIFAKNMNYLRVQGSLLTLLDATTEHTIGKLRLDDSFETCAIWGRLERVRSPSTQHVAPDVWSFESVDYSLKGSSFLDTLPYIRSENIVPLIETPTCVAMGTPREPTKMINDFTVGNEVTIKFRRNEGQPAPTGSLKNVLPLTLVCFNSGKFLTEYVTVPFPDHSRFSALEPITKVSLVGYPSDTTIFVVVSGKFTAEDRPSLIVLDSNPTKAHEELFKVEVFDKNMDKEFLRGELQHFVAFTVSPLSNNQWKITPVQEYIDIQSEKGVEKLKAKLAKSQNRVLQSLKVGDTLPLEMPSTGVYELAAGLYLPNIIEEAIKKGVESPAVTSADAAYLKVYCFDYFNHNAKLIDPDVERKVLANINGNDRAIIQLFSANEENLPVVGEHDTNQLRVVLFNEFPFRTLHFKVVIREKSYFKPKDPIVLKLYDTRSFKEIARVETEFNGSTEILFGSLERDALSNNYTFKRLDKEAFPAVPGTLQIKAIRGRGLAAMDPNGFSDPYVKLKFNSKKIGKSPIRYKTLEPEWNHTFQVPLKELATGAQDLVLSCWDEDALSRNDPMGAVVLKGADIFPTERWFPLKPQKEKHTHVTGELLLGISFTK